MVQVRGLVCTLRALLIETSLLDGRCGGSLLESSDGSSAKARSSCRQHLWDYWTWSRISHDHDLCADAVHQSETSVAGGTVSSLLVIVGAVVTNLGALVIDEVVSFRALNALAVLILSAVGIASGVLRKDAVSAGELVARVACCANSAFVVEGPALGVDLRAFSAAQEVTS